SSIGGQFSFDRLQAMRIDGMLADWFNANVEGTWTFIDADDGGLHLDARLVYGEGADRAVQLTADAILAEQDLLLQYTVLGSLSEALKELTAVELHAGWQEMQGSGSIRFVDFYNPAHLASWAASPFNLPFVGRLEGSAELGL